MRVLEDGVCDIQVRMHYIEERYGLIYGKGKKLIMDLEEKLFNAIDLKPNQLEVIIEKEGLEYLAID